MHEEQTTDYPAYEPNGGPTRAYNPSFQTPPQVPPNPFGLAPEQSNPVISNFKKRNNRKKQQQQALLAVPQPMQGATQGVVIHQVLRAAPPGQHWILVPTQPSGNEIPQTRHLEYNSTGGALEAQPPQPRPEPLSVLQLQQPVLPPLIPKPQATELVLGKDTSMEDGRTPKLQVDGSDKLYAEETLARMEQAAKASRANFKKGWP